MKPIAILNKDFDGVLRIEYIIGTLCNYKCHYCYDGCNDGKYRFPTDFNMVTKNLSHMLKIYKEHLGKQNVRINLTGGEPSLWPELGEFAEYFSKNHDCKISIVTNASRTMRFWMEYAKYFDDISISVHNEFADVDHIIEELQTAPNIILFIDEIHQIVGAGNSSGSLDASNIFKPALARGEIQCTHNSLMIDASEYKSDCL